MRNIFSSFAEVSKLEEEDLSNFASRVEEVLQGSGLNLLIHNAGIAIRDKMDIHVLNEVFTINAFAPLLLTKVCLP